MDISIFIGQGIFFFARTRARIYISALAAWVLCAGSLNVFALDNALEKTIADMRSSKITICLPAIEALGRSKQPSVIPPLAKAYDREKRPLVRRYIVDALGLLKDSSSLPTLKLALKDPDAQVRMSAVSALGLLGIPESDELLTQTAAQENDPQVKAQVAYHQQLNENNHRRHEKRQGGKKTK